MSKVSAKIKSTGQSIEVDYPPLDVKTIKEAVDAFTEKVVLAHFLGSTTVSLQSLLRGLMKAKKTDKEIQAAVTAWKPGMKTPGKSKLEKAEDLLGAMSAEERRDLLKKFQGK